MKRTQTKAKSVIKTTIHVDWKIGITMAGDFNILIIQLIMDDYRKHEKHER